MPKQPSKKQLIAELERLKRELEIKSQECTNLNQRNNEYEAMINEYREENEKYKKSAPSPAREKVVNSHLRHWGAERIQTFYRGRLARKKVRETVLQLAEYNEDDFESKYDIEEGEYEHLLQRSSEVKNQDEEMNKAASKIQAVHRGRKSRAEAKVRTEQTMAVNKIAAVHRGRRSRAKVKELKDQTNAVNKIAAVQRGRKSREKAKEYKKQTQAAVRIQAIQRGRISRSKSPSRGLTDEECNYDSGIRNNISRSGNDDMLEQTNAVNKIAAIQRGRKSRAQVRELKEQTNAVNKIAAVQRGRKLRAEVQLLREQTDAAVKIQAIHRGRTARSRSPVTHQEYEQNSADEDSMSDLSDITDSNDEDQDSMSDLSDITDSDEEDQESPKRVKSIPYKILSKEEADQHRHVITHHVGKLV